MPIAYERTTPKLIKVLKDGVFVGFLEKGYRHPTGFDRGFTYWSGTISGQEIWGETITAAKAKIGNRT